MKGNAFSTCLMKQMDFLEQMNLLTPGLSASNCNESISHEMEIMFSFWSQYFLYGFTHPNKGTTIKVVLKGYHRYIFGVKVKTVKENGLDDLKTTIYACPNHTDDGIHSDHGFLDTCDNPLGPP